MKKLIASILTVLTVGASAQLTFVREYNLGDNHIYFPQNSRGTNTYVELNQIDNELFLVEEVIENKSSDNYKYNLLNMDWTFYKTMNIDTSGALSILNINNPNDIWASQMFSNHLFNSDDKVELIYSVRGYNSELNQSESVKTVIVNEDGVILQEINGEGFNDDLYPVINGKTHVLTKTNSGSYKLYSVEGHLPCPVKCNNSSSSTNKSQPIAAKSEYSFQISPNPANHNLNIESDLDESNMEMKIYTTSGQLLQSEAFFGGSNQIDVSSLVSGTYVINVISGNKFLHTEQFIKQ